MERLNYNLSDIPDDVMKALDAEMERNPRLDVDEFYKRHNIAPVYIPEVVEQPKKAKAKVDDSAKVVRSALRLVSAANRQLGMVKGEELLVPKLASVDPTVIAAAPEKAAKFYGIAAGRLRRAIGTRIFDLVMGDDYDPQSSGDNKLIARVQERLFGPDNTNFRRKVYRQLDKLAGNQTAKATK